MSASWKHELALVERVIHAWAAYSPAGAPGAGRADILRSTFPEQYNSAHLKSQIERISSIENEISMQTIGGFIQVTPVTVGLPHLYPLLNIAIRVKGGELELGMRVVTFYEDTLLECIDAHGWRFDMADPMPGEAEEVRDSHHSFPHVQRIVGWLPSQLTFFPPGLAPAQRGTGYGENMSGPLLNESRPAFPLPVRSPAGMLAAAMVSLYGSKIATRILENVSQKPGEFRREIAMGYGVA